MDRNDILDAIRELSFSQGFYGRLLRDFMELKAYDPDAFDDVMTQLEAQKFGDTLDMVLFFEQ